MNMICGAVDNKSRGPHLVNDPAQIREEIGSKFRADQRPPFLRAEDQMDHEISRSLRQSFFRRLRGLVELACNPGLTPWAAFLRRFAAIRLSRPLTVSDVIPVTTRM